MGQVKLSQVQKRYEGGVTAVQGVDLEIADGEFVVLVGPSGCGKSTTLRMVAGLEDISAGTIQIGPRVVNDLPPKARDIAMVFQNYALYPHMSCFDNMAFSLRLSGKSPSEVKRRVEETAEVLGILPLLSRKPKQLSGGQRQRVAVGRAMVRNPAVYLFDEPLSNLDARLRVEMRAELKRLHARLRTTTLYVTHDQEEAMTLGDRVVVMSEGKVQQVGAPLAVYNVPVNRFVAGFLGSPPMNFVNGTLDDDRRFLGGGLSLRFDGPRGDRLRNRQGRDVVLGIRPDALEIVSDEDAQPVHVDLTEPLGSLVDLYLTTPSGQRLLARCHASRAPRAGTSARVRLQSTHCHLFAPGSHGENLTMS